MHPDAIFTNLNKKESERLFLLSESDIKIQEVERPWRSRNGTHGLHYYNLTTNSVLKVSPYR
jgi:hypothetical protein